MNIDLSTPVDVIADDDQKLEQMVRDLVGPLLSSPLLSSPAAYSLIDELRT